MRTGPWMIAASAALAMGLMALYEIETVDSHRRSLKLTALPIR